MGTSRLDAKREMQMAKSISVRVSMQGAGAERSVRALKEL